jgi:hypothetical protein
MTTMYVSGGPNMSVGTEPDPYIGPADTSRYREIDYL